MQFYVSEQTVCMGWLTLLWRFWRLSYAHLKLKHLHSSDLCGTIFSTSFCFFLILIEGYTVQNLKGLNYKLLVMPIIFVSTKKQIIYQCFRRDGRNLFLHYSLLALGHHNCPGRKAGWKRGLRDVHFTHNGFVVFSLVHRNGARLQNQKLLSMRKDGCPPFYPSDGTAPP